MDRVAFLFAKKLQSTLPKRVETSVGLIDSDYRGTSIHSTQTGRDVTGYKKMYEISYFNPLYPNG